MKIINMALSKILTSVVKKKLGKDVNVQINVATLEEAADGNVKLHIDANVEAKSSTILELIGSYF